MTWLRIDDSFSEHPKVAGLSDRAFRVHVRAMVYAARHTTDGAIPEAMLRQWGAIPKVRAELVSARVWDESPLRLHDYLEYNPSAKQIDSKRQSKVIAGAKGAASRWHVGGNAPVPDPIPIPAAAAADAGARGREAKAATIRQTMLHGTGVAGDSDDRLTRIGNLIDRAHGSLVVTATMRDSIAEWVGSGIWAHPDQPVEFVDEACHRATGSEGFRKHPWGYLKPILADLRERGIDAPRRSASDSDSDPAVVEALKHAYGTTP